MDRIEKIVIASGNRGKVTEIAEVLGAQGIEVLSQSEFGVPEVAETGLSFVENAIIKARHAAQYTDFPVLSDDSGLEVDALAGAPGIYSARYAGVAATDNENVAALLAALEEKQVREAGSAARFQCAMVMMRHKNDAMPFVFQGTWEGRTLPAPQGASGFGYDPIFYVPEHQCSAAELPAAIKNKISHRARALERFFAALQSLC